MTDWNVGDLSFEQWVERPGGGGRRRRADASRSRCSASRRAPRRAIAYAVAASRARLAPDPLRRLRARLGTPGDQPRASASTTRSSSSRAPAGARTTRPSARCSRRGSSPAATDEQIGWFNELCRKTTSPENAGDLLEMRARDRHRVAARRRCGCRRSCCTRAATTVAPVAEGRFLAARHPGRAVRRARLGATTSCSSTSRPGGASARPSSTSWGSPRRRPARTRRSTALSPRERAILGLLTEGLSNAEIAERLSISEKTVRNHVSEPLRQARRVDPRPGHRLRPRPRVQE